jgi:hypothetical protein
MKTRTLNLILASALAFGSGFARAADEAPLSPAVVQQLDLVNKLIALGDARKDPILLLAAASIQKSLGTDNNVLPAKSTAPDDVLLRAREMSVGRPELLNIANEVSAVKSKGASWRIDAVTGRSTYRY